MKYILELIIATIIIFFVWNILKRLFFSAFYKNFPFLNPKNRQQNEPKASKKMPSQKVNWDAETVDYEEIKEENKH